MPSSEPLLMTTRSLLNTDATTMLESLVWSCSSGAVLLIFAPRTNRKVAAGRTVSPVYSLVPQHRYFGPAAQSPRAPGLPQSSPGVFCHPLVHLQRCRVLSALQGFAR